MKVAIAMRDRIRAFGGWLKLDRTRSRRRELNIVMDHVELISA